MWTASLCCRLADNNKGSRCSIFIFGLLARPERAAVDESRQPHRGDSQNHILVPPTPRGSPRSGASTASPSTTPRRSLPQGRGGGAQDASASARAASSAKKTSDSRDGGRISLKEDRMDAALRAAISTMGDGVRAGRSSSL